MADSDLFSYGAGDLDAEKRASSPVYIKVPARQGVTVCLLQEEPLRFAVHFYPGGSVICWGRGRCSRCADHDGKKVKYLYRAFDMTNRCMGIADFTPFQQEAVELARAKQGFVKGLAWKLKKAEGKENGKLMAECTHQLMDYERWGEPLDLEDIVCKQYGLERSILQSAGS